MPYRLEDITAAERMEVATLLLGPEGAYGLVTGPANPNVSHTQTRPGGACLFDLYRIQVDFGRFAKRMTG